jgi:hypothetical protein
MLLDTLDGFLNKKKVAKLLHQENWMPREVTSQPSSLALPSPMRETNKAVERNGGAEVTEKLRRSKKTASNCRQE